MRAEKKERRVKRERTLPGAPGIRMATWKGRKTSTINQILPTAEKVRDLGLTGGDRLVPIHSNWSRIRYRTSPSHDHRRHTMSIKSLISSASVHVAFCLVLLSILSVGVLRADTNPCDGDAGKPCPGDYPIKDFCPGQTGTNPCETVPGPTDKNNKDQVAAAKAQCNSYIYYEIAKDYFQTSSVDAGNVAACPGTATNCKIAWACSWDDSTFTCDTSDTIILYLTLTKGTYVMKDCIKPPPS